MALLEVDGLSVSFRTDDGIVRAVQDLTFSLEAGQTLGIVGESGSGKSVSTQTIMGLTRGATVTGRALFEGRDLLTMPLDQLNAIRGRDIAMIFQDPLSSLHPHYTVGQQIEEVVLTHTDRTKKQARALAVDLLGRVGIPEPHRRVDEHPHQFSGGMRQRAMIAMALTLDPRLIIADEPTTALDVTVQAQILDLLAGLREEYNAALVMITHDLGVIAEIADNVMIMYAGKSVEFADRRSTYYSPHHPYTKGLIESIPAHTGARQRLTPIQGTPPSLIQLPTGCSFHPRCTYVMDQCLTTVPPLRPVEGGAAHRSACWLPTDEVGFGADVEARRAKEAAARRPTAEHVAEAAAATGTELEDELAGLATAPDADVRHALVEDAAALSVGEPGSTRGSVRLAADPTVPGASVPDGDGAAPDGVAPNGLSMSKESGR